MFLGLPRKVVQSLPTMGDSLGKQFNHWVCLRSASRNKEAACFGSRPKHRLDRRSELCVRILKVTCTMFILVSLTPILDPAKIRSSYFTSDVSQPQMFQRNPCSCSLELFFLHASAPPTNKNHRRRSRSPLARVLEDLELHTEAGRWKALGQAAEPQAEALSELRVVEPRVAEPRVGFGPIIFGWRPFISLPELVDFKLFGKTILVVNEKFKPFLASQLGK